MFLQEDLYRQTNAALKLIFCYILLMTLILELRGIVTYKKDTAFKKAKVVVTELLKHIV